MRPPNGLRISRAAPIDRDYVVADSNPQNRPDRVDAERRRVHARVGRLSGFCSFLRICLCSFETQNYILLWEHRKIRDLIFYFVINLPIRWIDTDLDWIAKFRLKHNTHIVCAAENRVLNDLEQSFNGV